MGSQKCHASAKETLGNQKEGNTGYDLPKDLKPWQRFASESTRYIVPLDASSSSWLCYSSDSEDFVVTSLYTTPALDTPDSTPTLIEVADDEAIESPGKVAHVLVSEGYKPHSRVSAVRDYPISIVPVNTTDSTGFQELSYKVSDPEDPSEAQSDSEESCRKSSSKNPEIVPLRRCNRAVAVRDFPFPQSSLQTPFSQYLVQPQLSDASEPECEAKEPSKEVELELSVNTYGLVPGDSIISMNNISLNLFGLSSEDGGIDIDSVGLVDRSETSEHEPMEEIASNFNTPDSMSFETKQLSHRLSDAQDPLDAQSDSEESCGKSNLKNPENLPLRRSNQLLKKAPNTAEKPVPKRKAMEATNKRKRSKH